MDTIKSFFAGKYLGMSYADSAVDFNNYEEPLKRFIQTEFFVLDVNNYKTTALYFKNVEIFDDDDILSYNNQMKISSYMKDYVKSDFSQGALEDMVGPLAEFQLYSSENLLQIKRSYQNLGQMLAFLSGIYSLLKFMGELIIHFEVQCKIKNQIMNFLYDFDFGNNYKKFNSSVQLMTKKKKSKFNLKKERNFPILYHKIEIFWMKLKKEFRMILSLFFDKNYQEEYFNLINLRTVFKSLHDLQKMKIVLFESQQLKLFDQMKRPKISFSNQTSTKTIVDPGLKLLDLMRYSYRADTKRSKRDESKIPNTLDEKLNFFNSIKCPINV